MCFTIITIVLEFLLPHPFPLEHENEWSIFEPVNTNWQYPTSEKVGYTACVHL